MAFVRVPIRRFTYVRLLLAACTTMERQVAEFRDATACCCFCYGIVKYRLPGEEEPCALTRTASSASWVMLAYTSKPSLAASSAAAALVSFELPVAVCTGRLVVQLAIKHVDMARRTHTPHSMQQQDISGRYHSVQ